MLTTVEWEEFREDLQFCESLKQVVKALRGSVKQHVLAENAGVSIETIRRVEQGRAKEISQNHLTLVAKALGLTPRQLVIRAQAIPVQPHAMPIQTRGLGQLPPIGREEDKQRIIMDLAEARGVLLFGAPGQGKTTLARYVAAEIGSNFRHGVCEVDLESERQIENLPRLIAVHWASLTCLAVINCYRADLCCLSSIASIKCYETHQLSVFEMY